MEGMGMERGVYVDALGLQRESSNLKEIEHGSFMRLAGP